MEVVSLYPTDQLSDDYV